MNKEQKEQNFTLDEIIEQSFDFSGYSEEEKNSMIGETSGLIMETALLRVLDEADESVQKRFNDFLEEEPDSEKMSEFIQENFPKFSEVVLEEVKLFQESESGEAEDTV